MSDQAEIGAGDVQITFADGQTVTLRPSLAACQGICRLHGHLGQTVQKAANGDIDTITSVILFGLGSPGGQRARLIPDLVYRTGVYVLSADVIRFIDIVANGGRPLSANKQEAQSDEENPQESALG